MTAYARGFARFRPAPKAARPPVRWGWAVFQGLRWGLAWILANWIIHCGWGLAGWPAL